MSNDQVERRVHLERAIELSGSVNQFARTVVVRPVRTVRRWLSGESPIPDVVANGLHSLPVFLVHVEEFGIKLTNPIGGWDWIDPKGSMVIGLDTDGRASIRGACNTAVTPYADDFGSPPTDQDVRIPPAPFPNGHGGDLRQALRHWGLSAAEFGRSVIYRDGKTVRSWLHGKKSVPSDVQAWLRGQSRLHVTKSANGIQVQNPRAASIQPKCAECGYEPTLWSGRTWFCGHCFIEWAVRLDERIISASICSDPFEFRYEQRDRPV